MPAAAPPDLLLEDPARTAILLDVDGTLAPIVRHAEDAHVPEPTRGPLIAVARRFGLVACVSGRRAAVARRIVSLGSITYVGNHGAEVLRGGATAVELDPEVGEHVAHVQGFAQGAYDEALQRLRVRLEDKEVIWAFHWRGAPDEAAAEAAVRDVAARAEAEGLWVHWGRKVLEVRPPVALDKGRGITRLLERFEPVRVAAYAGDDRTDIDAFDGLRALRDAGRLDAVVCIGVASDETPPELEAAADVMVDGPPGVRRFLQGLADA